MTNRNQHRDDCSCWRCTAQLYGRWFDELGLRTLSGRWMSFTTISFATSDFPWQRGFPMGISRPNAEFAHNFFSHFIAHFEDVSDGRIDYAVADQLGCVTGRLHMHALLAGRSLDERLRQSMEAWLTSRAGYSRVLPFEKGAAFYISRFIGRGASHCEWDVRVGEQKLAQVRESEKRGTVLVASAELPKSLFHQNLSGRRR
jgi:hypothetical protein